jgi:hypothetical protein
MTERKRGVTRWHRVGGGWCSLGMGVAGHFLAVIRGLPCIASGLTLLSSGCGRARVYLEWRKRRIHPPTHDKSPQHRAGEFSNSFDGHALGDSPPTKNPSARRWKTAYYLASERPVGPITASLSTPQEYPRVIQCTRQLCSPMQPGHSLRAVRQSATGGSALRRMASSHHANGAGTLME